MLNHVQDVSYAIAMQDNDKCIYEPEIQTFQLIFHMKLNLPIMALYKFLGFENEVKLPTLKQ